MIGSLLYLIINRLNIPFSVGVCDQFEANLRVFNLDVVKRIINFFSEIYGYGIWYSYDYNTNVIGYSYIDWIWNVEDRKSTSDRYFYLWSNMVA